MRYASSYLRYDGIAHQAPSGDTRAKAYDPVSERTERSRARAFEEINACLNCKREDCVATCPEMIAIRKKYRRKKQ